MVAAESPVIMRTCGMRKNRSCDQDDEVACQLETYVMFWSLTPAPNRVKASSSRVISAFSYKEGLRLFVLAAGIFHDLLTGFFTGLVVVGLLAISRAGFMTHHPCAAR
jgi:hypothetical protein